MALRIEDYALIGNCASAALVGRDGSIDWMGMPRFDSEAFFAALLGTADNGRWLLAPADGNPSTARRYRPGTLVLETDFETDTGKVRIIDCMGRDGNGNVIRVVEGLTGSVKMQMELVIRFGYGLMMPWVSRAEDGRLTAVAGPERLTLTTSVEIEGIAMRSVAEFKVEAGERVCFVLTWTPSIEPPPEPIDALAAIETITRGWQRWSADFDPALFGPHAELVLRSLLTLKALTHYQTGGIAAAATTSLPEAIGGARNWDYRYCWLRDATLTLTALEKSGFRDEARQWCAWLRRAIAGAPQQMQIMYGLAGERRLLEYEIPWLSGYEHSQPVRIGNAASEQLQLDVFGEVMGALHEARRLGLLEDNWPMERALVEHLETIWEQPDAGMWEIRGMSQSFTFSKVMVWVAFDRAIRNIEEFDLEGPLERWCQLRERLRLEILERGFNAKLNSFTQYYGGEELDASLLLIPATGFLPADDPRIVGTVAAVERELLRDGFVLRYRTATGVDGLAGDEGAFLACSFWLVDAYVGQGRMEDARALFERLVGLCNDVGLLAEEYEPRKKRQIGNFPQAFSHVALINAALSLQSGQDIAETIA
ncbi:Glucoamylase (glucan-1,4-alpha-glucosidase), GH15 family [Arboricoccus pini]|uniref:Trehalase n=1 Tax=Arboricoccus pini TaxID=1963835 RepID=A0A212PXH9_9PROT|nr:glycoside hydrolase family 15 protein [Arboricoccus pini]SNB51759.1 Glucoamylase (glucan-1,4-alpha-glucosidase), GH15 family [Arboricoccus pini]